jgi:hypothetical protein
VVLIFGFITFLFSFKSTQVVETGNVGNVDSIRIVKIHLDTEKDLIEINGVSLEYRYDMYTIEMLIGKPDRIIIDSNTVYIEELGYDGSQPLSYPEKVQDQYYIYDELGLMFYTKNKGFTEKHVQTMMINFEMKRTFSNTAALKYQPKKTFSGELKLNQNLITNTTDFIPERVNYRTEEFALLGTSFGPTSIGGETDRLYSIGSKPYLLIYLNNAKDQKLSYIEIK